MIKKAFTLLELVFVIVIIGIMTAIASNSFKTNYLLNDTNFITLKIKNAQSSGIGYNHLDFGGSLSANTDNSVGCIEIKNSSLEEKASNTNEVSYKLHVTLDPDDTVICFDSKGRPHDGNFTDNFNENLLTSQKTITLRYGEDERNLTIQAITGYVIVEY
jgi:prepilin-type N-terminal cleavage/methylation domain-containing protein